METKQQQQELTEKRNNFLKKCVSSAAQSLFDNTPMYIKRKDETFWEWWKRSHKTVVKLAHERNRWRIFKEMAKKKNLYFFMLDLLKNCTECAGDGCEYCPLNHPTKDFIRDQYLEYKYYKFNA